MGRLVRVNRGGGGSGSRTEMGGRRGQWSGREDKGAELVEDVVK